MVYSTVVVLTYSLLICMYMCMIRNLWDLYQISSREAQPSIIYLYMNLRIKKCDSVPPISFVLSIMKLLAVGFESTIMIVK